MRRKETIDSARELPMSGSESTRWTLIRGAADGSSSARAEFARRYGPIIVTYLRARWRHFPLLRDIDDAAQEVFLDCFREGGALTRADPERPGGFRAFLYGVTRNVARRVEERWAGRREREESAVDLLRLRFDEGLPIREIARIWEVDAPWLHREYAKARGEFKAALREVVRAHHGEGAPAVEAEVARLLDALK